MQWPPITESVQRSLDHVLRSGDWASYAGPHSEHLACRLAARFDREHVQLCNSGTIGVELALRGLLIRPGDQVLLSGYDYPGNFRCIEMIGATPVLCEVSTDSWTIRAADLLNDLPEPWPKALIVSHLHGHTADMPSICDWCRDRGILVIEDACQATGAIIAGRPAGSWGDVSVLSFGGSKLMTAGRGGAVMTNDARIAQRMTIFRERGNDAFAMSEVQAALLLFQLEQLDSWRVVRSIAVDQFIKTLHSNPVIRCPHEVHSSYGPNQAYYKLGMLLGDGYEPQRAEIIERLERKAIRCGEGFSGFANRSNSRCIKPMSLHNATAVANKTIVIHHTELVHCALRELNFSDNFPPDDFEPLLRAGRESGQRLAEIVNQVVAEILAKS